MPLDMQLGQYVLGIQSCKTKGDVVEILQEIRNRAIREEHKWWTNKLEDLKHRLQEEGIHQRKSISVFRFDKILREVFLDGRKW